MFFQYERVPAGPAGIEAVRTACSDEDRPIVVLCFAPGGDRAVWLSEPRFVEPLRVATDGHHGTIMLAPSAEDEAFFTLGSTIRMHVSPEERAGLTEYWGDDPILLMYAGRLAVSVVGGLEELPRDKLQRLLLRLIKGLESAQPFDEVAAAIHLYRVKHFAIRHQAAAQAAASNIVRALLG